MASAELRDELNCSICLSLYTDPIFLRCGHNFCRSCIVSALDAQEAGGVYSCPDCRAEYPDRPALEKNRKLSNIVEHFLSNQPDMEKTRTFCSYCTKSPVPAVKSCLQCENSLCDEHLTVHNQTMDHVLSEPTSSFGIKKCSIHKKVLEYYCPQDEACLCVSCCLFGKHRGHQVERLDEASEKMRKKVRKYLDELNPQKSEVKARIQSLQKHKGEIQVKVSEKRNNINKLFMDIKEQLEIAEKKVLNEISRQEMKILSQISDLIKKLEIKEDKLSRNMSHVEEMCCVTDPIRLLQKSDFTVCSSGDDEDTGGDGRQINSEEVGLVPGQAEVHVFDKMQDNETDPRTVLQESGQSASLSDKNVEAQEEKNASVSDAEMADDLEDVLISSILHRSMKDVVSYVRSELGIHVPDILLDVDTAQTRVALSEDLRTATCLEEKQGRPDLPGSFLIYCQVLSRCRFSSGRHYWEAEWNQTGDCGIGMSYPSIEKNGYQSGIDHNDKSWCLFLSDKRCSAFHNSVNVNDIIRTCPKLGVFLDYEAGRLSFYQLCDPIRHMHTFRASFTEPLLVILYVFKGASVKIRS